MIDTVIVSTYLAGALTCWVLATRYFIRKDPDIVGPAVALGAIMGVAWPGTAIVCGARVIAARYAQRIPPNPVNCPACNHRYRSGEVCVEHRPSFAWQTCTCDCPAEVHAARFGARP